MTTPDTYKSADYIQRHDEEARRLSRMTVSLLRREYQVEMAKAGATMLLGGPVHKDELIRAVLELRYPEYRRIHEERARAEAERQRRMAVSELALRLAHIQDADLEAVLSSMHPDALLRLRRMTAGHGAPDLRGKGQQGWKNWLRELEHDSGPIDQRLAVTIAAAQRAIDELESAPAVTIPGGESIHEA